MKAVNQKKFEIFQVFKSILFFLCFAVFISLEAKQERPKICLNMIVKNESRVIGRCLESVKPLIDYWVIVDTGSTDGTQAMIKALMKDVKGELHERPWKNFGHNRNEALTLAKNKGDYLLFIDADEVLDYPSSFCFPKLDLDFYYLMTTYGGTQYARVQLIKNGLDWMWKGVLHEAVDCPLAKQSAILEGITTVVHTDGFRSTDPQKYQKDAAILEAALKEEPENRRYVFYLAQSYKDANYFYKALENYQRRVEMKGWEEEVFWSLLQIATLKEQMGFSDEQVISSYYEAFSYRPKRAEPLYQLAHFYRKKGNYGAGYVMAKAGLMLDKPKDLLFVQSWMYDYGLLLEFSICAYWIGCYQDSLQASQQILSLKELPLQVRECVQKNISFAEQKLKVK